MDIIKIQTQVDENRRSVAFDSYDLAVRQLFDMTAEGMIDVAPEYQRHFIWNETRQSQLIESLILGIPVPSLFMATNRDSTWEVIDGLQRLTTLINFMGDEDLIKKINPHGKKLKLCGLEKLDSINHLHYEDLPPSLKIMFSTRPIRVTVLNDRSDFALRYDLFERLNTGGITLHPQEIRNCLYIGPFKDFLVECAQNTSFKKVLKINDALIKTGTLEELALKFFAYYEDRNLFVHSVKGFLNDYMAKKTKQFKNKEELQDLFEKTFQKLAQTLPDGIVRSNRKNTTPLVLYEAIAIGVADAIKNEAPLKPSKLRALLDSSELKGLTTAATNSRARLNQRINFVYNAISA
jgi:hypothetical protein